MEERVREIVADVLGVDAESVDERTGMDNVDAWDSLAHINICLALEQEFRISFDVAEMEGMRTVADILETVRAKR